MKFKSSCHNLLCQICTYKKFDNTEAQPGIIHLPPSVFMFSLVFYQEKSDALWDGWYDHSSVQCMAIILINYI